MSFSHLLRTSPIPQHFGDIVKHTKPGKIKRPTGDPVSYPKPHPRFISPPSTDVTSFSLDMDVILPEETKAAVQTNSLVFHAVGDTGSIHGDDTQKAIADAMDQETLKL